MKKNFFEIRNIFLKYFKDRNHKYFPSSSLVPINDNSLLFTNSGMNQFKDFFLGKEIPKYTNIVTSQRCLRVGGKHNDLNNIGYNLYHNSFFEMLGNFSFGGYFKKEAIQFAWDLLTNSKWFSLDKNKFWITVYFKDIDTYKIWKNVIKIPKYRIIKVFDFVNKKFFSSNFWQMGEIGPCGPCSEIFYQNKNIDFFPKVFTLDDLSKYCIEVWNLVFIQFSKLEDGSLLKLSNYFIDTGMSLERISLIIENVSNNYKISIFSLLIKDIISVLNLKNFSFSKKNKKNLYIIADHMRACVFLIADGVIPLNEGRGYVLRKIIRRIILQGNFLGIKKVFCYKLVLPVINIMSNLYKYIKDHIKHIQKILYIEETLFLKTLQKGIILLNKKLLQLNKKTLDGKFAFLLYDTFGFPLDLTVEICKLKGIKVNTKKYYLYMNKQKNKSKNLSFFFKKKIDNFFLQKQTIFLGYKFLFSTSLILKIVYNNCLVSFIKEGMKAILILDKTTFYAESGGQLGDCGIITNKFGTFIVLKTKSIRGIYFHYGFVKFGILNINSCVESIVNDKYRKNISCNHTATHILYIVLRNFFSTYIFQKGSMISDKYFRFDFFCDFYIDFFHIQDIEKKVNKIILKNYPVLINENYIKEMQDKKYMFLNFQNKKNIFRTVKIGNFSSEFCCGTHVQNTMQISTFHITSFRSIASSIFRIEAMTNMNSIMYIQKRTFFINSLKKMFKVNIEKELLVRIINLQNNYLKIQKRNYILQLQRVHLECKLLLSNIFYINKYKMIIKMIDSIDLNFLRKIVFNIINIVKISYIMIASIVEKNSFFVIFVNKNFLKFFDINRFLKDITFHVKGKLVKKKYLFQIIGKRYNNLPSILKKYQKKIQDFIKI